MRYFSCVFKWHFSVLSRNCQTTPSRFVKKWNKSSCRATFVSSAMAVVFTRTVTSVDGWTLSGTFVSLQSSNSNKVTVIKIWIQDGWWICCIVTVSYLGNIITKIFVPFEGRSVQYVSSEQLHIRQDPEEGASAHNRPFLINTSHPNDQIMLQICAVVIPEISKPCDLTLATFLQHTIELESLSLESSIISFSLPFSLSPAHNVCWC